MELKRDEIIKALEWCGKYPCDQCPYYTDAYCPTNLRKDALSLIKELTEENERLKQDKKILELQVEGKERICESYMLQYGTVADKEVFLKKERADTVRKMQERLMECFNNEVEHLAMYPEAQVIFAIDQIAKEMIGEGND